MSILVFSDVHGNLPAFEKMIKQERDVSKYISLGDIVNYGPWSNECVDLLESLNAVKLMGNHEEYFIDGMYPGKNELVINFFNICLADFRRMDEIRNYKSSFEDGNFKFVHTIRDESIFPDTPINHHGKYFIGHSHHQFDRSGTGYRVINVGSVGQNRKEINVIHYALYEPESGLITLRELIYDIQPLIQKMRERKYPEDCINYYLHKSFRS